MLKDCILDQWGKCFLPAPYTQYSWFVDDCVVGFTQRLLSCVDFTVSVAQPRFGSMKGSNEETILAFSVADCTVSLWQVA